MDTADKAKLLGSTELFGGCSQHQLDEVASLSEERTYAAGDLLCRQREPGNEAFVIVAGEVTVSIDGQVVATIGPGDVVGEASLIRGRRAADVTAVGEVTALAVDYREIDDALSAKPDVAGPAFTHLIERGPDS